jgi:hypothetical protein
MPCDSLRHGMMIDSILEKQEIGRINRIYKIRSKNQNQTELVGSRFDLVNPVNPVHYFFASFKDQS